ncbi:MAG: hypothetical protein JW881_20505 [Spirochaetales bacterium]|nr:hypothetical protein [Spirochaetales bacterium]
MKKKEFFTIRMRIYVVLWVILVFTGPIFARTGPVWRVDDIGNLTVDGEIFRVKGGSWTGLEGRPDFIDEVISTAPMELYIGNMWWVETGSTYEQDIAEFKDMGFSLSRLTIAPRPSIPTTLWTGNRN